VSNATVVSNLLQDARGKLEQGWCQKFLAVDGKGCAVDVNSPNVVAWCAIGSLAAIGSDDEAVSPVRSMAYVLLAQALDERLKPISTLGAYNDATDRTKEDMLSLFDRAIELTKSLEETKETASSETKEENNDEGGGAAATSEGQD
jgi:hypothetical protein